MVDRTATESHPTVSSGVSGDRSAGLIVRMAAISRTRASVRSINTSHFRGRQQAGSPGVPHAKTNRHDAVARFGLPAPERALESHRYGRRDSVAVRFEIDAESVGGNADFIAQALEHEPVGLMKNEQVD